MEWYLMVWRKYADFDGRSRRTEYWMFVLLNFLAMLALGAVGVAGIAISQDDGGFLFIPLGIYALAALIPGLAVAVRRFHDTGKSGWVLLALSVFGAIPLVGLIATIVQLVFLCTDSDPGVNQYGPNPKLPQQAAGTFGGVTAYPAAGFSAPSQSFMGENSSRLCARCGTRINPELPFCSNCGTPY